jgi:indole-3-glycerol phosphate synthase
LIGVNNRNLKTFEVDINNSINLKNSFSGNNIFIAESGIKNRKDMNYLKEEGIKVFLIGESLMRGNF